AYLLEPLLTLGWAAAATTRIGLGTSVMVVPQYHPLQLANAIATLDQLSGGRVTLGVGVGWSEGEFAALDQEFANRGRRLDEAIDVMRTVWSEEPASFAGEHYSFEDLKVQPKPAHRIPIWVGGGAEATFRRAVERGDGFHAISTPPEALAPIVARLRAARPEPEFVVSYRTGWDPQGMDPDVIAAEAIAAEAEAYAAAGVTQVVSAPWRDNLDAWIRSMELLVEIVPPAGQDGDHV
nr:TIGR03619 family F420-dependent LLM class oxidoreductase [Actinomycetota bacterium]NIS36786.1 TIGR03619 family F420-dependent LLM class oxidoreductase [Actinomycetota bacterium]NIT98909.1 TIGR03619 family F420-dependent LLM class oxidoreductase [Actinomycetota bacterium]NIU19309.1 TIGR03619 family F420-dependent LLM class oxidoreductase [Actinomycetota bacterium]NIU71275.1 TIGR03619 family F420-dependent LLM class oxidoreductase [Actinomycetota bacterium]